MCKDIYTSGCKINQADNSRVFLRNQKWWSSTEFKKCSVLSFLTSTETYFQHHPQGAHVRGRRRSGSLGGRWDKLLTQTEEDTSQSSDHRGRQVQTRDLTFQNHRMNVSKWKHERVDKRTQWIWWSHGGTWNKVHQTHAAALDGSCCSSGFHTITEVLRHVFAVGHKYERLGCETPLWTLSSQ